MQQLDSGSKAAFRLHGLANHEEVVMNRTIALGLVVLVTGASAAVAQDNIASFSDATGDRVLYVANDRGAINGGDIHEFSLNAGQPVDTDLTKLTNTGFAAYSTLTAFSDSNGQHAFFVGGADYHIHQLFFSFSLGSESGLDWTKLAGNAPLAQALPLTGFSNARGEHVYYTVWDSATRLVHVHHLFAKTDRRGLDGQSAARLDLCHPEQHVDQLC
jgi:hypothetical protein